MNIYDFDKTIFYPDSSVTFVIWSSKRHPWIFLFCLPIAFIRWLSFKFGIISKDRLKEGAFFFIRFIPDLEGDVKKFWEEHESRICPWYLEQRRPDDLVISASPEFLVKPMTDKLGISLIATRMDMQTGRILGENCFGEEKVRRFYEEYPNGKVFSFYSDSLTDAPMAELADDAYLIIDKGQTPVPWPDK